MCNKGDMHGEGGCMAKGVCVVKGDMCGEGGGHAWQEIWPLQLAVRILLECILVDRNSTCGFALKIQ